MHMCYIYPNARMTEEIVTFHMGSTLTGENEPNCLQTFYFQPVSPNWIRTSLLLHRRPNIQLARPQIRHQPKIRLPHRLRPDLLLPLHIIYNNSVRNHMTHMHSLLAKLLAQTLRQTRPPGMSTIPENESSLLLSDDQDDRLRREDKPLRYSFSEL